MDTMIEDEDTCKIVERDLQIHAKWGGGLIGGKAVGDRNDETFGETAQPEGKETGADNDWRLDGSILG
jgi:hypothetical protein